MDSLGFGQKCIFISCGHTTKFIGIQLNTLVLWSFVITNYNVSENESFKHVLLIYASRAIFFSFLYSFMPDEQTASPILE